MRGAARGGRDETDGVLEPFDESADEGIAPIQARQDVWERPRFARLAPLAPGQPQRDHGATKRADGLGRYAATLEADHVRGADARAIALDNNERWNIPLAHRAARNEGALAHANALRDAGKASKRDVVFEHHVARKLHAVGDDAVRSDNRIVGDVGPGHDEIVRANPGEPCAARSVDGDALAKHVGMADLEPPGGNVCIRRATILRSNLSVAAEDHEGMHLIALTDGGISADDHVA